MKLTPTLILTLLIPQIAYSQITKVSLLASYMDGSNLSCSDYNTRSDSFDWHATCSNSATTSGGAPGVKVQGIALCSTTAATSGAETQTRITDSFLALNAPGDLVYCWCKMIMPFTSDWVSVGGSYATTYDTTNGGISQGDCTSGCAQSCTFALTNMANFRQAMIGNSHN